MVAYGLFGLFQAFAAGLQSLSLVFLCRFLQGVFGAAPSAILSGTLADIWTPKQRGFAMPCTGTFLMIGPILGPIIGSVIVHSLGWRWIFNITALVTFSIILMLIPVATETYAPVLLARRASHMRHLTRNWALRAKSEETESNLGNIVETCLTRPAKMLVLEPILLSLSTYISVVFGM